MATVRKTPEEFYFNIGGTASQCRAIDFYYSDNIGIGPYYYTVVPLDGSQHVYDNQLGTLNPQSYSSSIYLPTGTRFTVVFR